MFTYNLGSFSSGKVLNVSFDASFADVDDVTVCPSATGSCFPSDTAGSINREFMMYDSYPTMYTEMPAPGETTFRFPATLTHSWTSTATIDVNVTVSDITCSVGLAGTSPLCEPYVTYATPDYAPYLEYFGSQTNFTLAIVSYFYSPPGSYYLHEFLSQV